MIVRDIISAALRRWWALVICVVLGAVLGVVAALVSTQQYTSDTLLLVATPHIDQSAQVPPGGISAQQRATNYATLATGSALTGKVIADLHLTLPANVLANRVKATVLPGTTVIQISATDPSPQEAQRIAQGFTDALVAAVPTVESQAGTAQQASITVTDPANLPLQPSSGSRASIVALGLIAGLVVGLLVLWLLEVLDTRIRGARDVARATGRPLVAGVGDDPSPTPQRLVSASPAHGRLAESYRSLRTALQFVQIDGSSPIFALVGPRTGTGTSTAAANLAAVMAQAGQRTLLVDADLHHPRLTAMLGLAADGPGLSDVLSGSAALADAVQPWTAGGADVLPAGTPPKLPTEQVQSKPMDDLLLKLRDSYDVIVLDTPPLGEVTDAALIAAASDVAILVTRAGFTTADEARAAVARLDVVRARIFGSVLLGAPEPGTVTVPAQPAGLDTA